ncbi:MAG TPA: methionyl-tRNA formyltransferase [Candidatus Paceibacterota bacterium]|nr:methionyl-tRNA formyltransferase [Candidatus Paceibacterota bacterium]
MSKDPLFAFFGTPKFAVDVLNALEAKGLLPALVITAPDRKQGRGMVLTPSPAKQWAIERGIDVLTPTTLKDEALVAELSNTEWDVFVVAAYAKLIPKNILEIPKHGCLNIHPSLLPKFRGPSPALSAILADERSTGVSVMQMAERMDAGPVIAQAKVELEEDAWPMFGSEFEELLATEGGNLLAEVLPFYIKGEITPEPQDESKATFTKKFTDANALIDLMDDPRKNYLKIKTFDKGPRAYMIVDNKRVIIKDAEFKDGILTITKVIPEGKKEMDYKDFVR